MKKIIRYNYNKRKDSPNGKWFKVYDIFCDNCGNKVMQDYLTLNKPDRNKDYCIDCLRNMI